jgi:hypothetical protein
MHVDEYIEGQTRQSGVQLPSQQAVVHWVQSKLGELGMGEAWADPEGVKVGGVGHSGTPARAVIVFVAPPNPEAGGAPRSCDIFRSLAPCSVRTTAGQGACWMTPVTVVTGW